MQISIISSSQRSDSQSLRVSEYIAERIEAVGAHAEVHDLHTLALTTDIDKAWESHAAQPVVDRLQACDGAVFVTPEWAGMPSPALMNLLLHVGESLAHKPVLLVGVSAGRGGAYPIAALRSLGYKNTKYVMIPEHLIFRSVGDLLHEGEPAGKEDLFMRRRTDHAVAELLVYAKGLESIRRDLPPTPGEFRFGM